MLEIVYAGLLGTVSGVVAGFLPGVGIFTVLSAAYLLLLSFDVPQLLIFYFCLVASSQYFGSIPAIFMGIAGEASSFPAVIEGHALMKQGHGIRAVFLTGVGSFVGGIFGIFALMAVGIIEYKFVLTTFQTLALFLTIGIFVCFTTKNRWYVNILLIVIAAALSHIGVSNNEIIPYINFGVNWLSNGISYFAVAAALISVKEVMSADLNISSSVYIQEKLFNPIKESLKQSWAIIRGSIAGALGGLVPGVTTIASSHFAYSIEKRIQKKHYTPGNMSALVSSESANNAGAITQLIPLLVFGIPITGSEAILYGILDAKNWEFNSLLPIRLFLEYWYIFLAVNFIGLVLSIKFAPYLIKVLPKNKKYLTWLVITILIGTTYYVGELTAGSGVFDVATFFVALVVLLILPKVDYLPLVFWMVIGETWLDSFYRWLKIIGVL